MDETKVAERLAVLEQDLKSIHRRIDNLEELTKSVQIVAMEVKAMREDVNDITDRVDDIEKKPTKRYETVVTACLTSVVTAVVGFVIGFFMK